MGFLCLCLITDSRKSTGKTNLQITKHLKLEAPMGEKKKLEVLHNNRTFGPTQYAKKHIFLDIDNVVEWDLGIYQHFPKPEKIPTTGLEGGPTGSWNARLAAGWGSILYEDGKFRGWVCNMPSIGGLDENADVWLTAYIESDDGFVWRKPNLRITGQDRWPGNNLLKLPGCIMSVVRPLHGAGFRYLAATIQIAPPYPGVCDDGSVIYNGNGTYLFASDDGFEWKQITANPIIVHGDWACLHVDRTRGRYLLFNKIGVNHGLTSRRSNIVVESKDAVHWEGYEGYRQWHMCFAPDDYDDIIAAAHGFRIGEFYNHAIHQVDKLYVAVQTLFMVGLPLRNIMGQNPAGQALMRLAFSHDGMIWRHPRGRPAFIEGGPPGSPDAGFITSQGNIVDVGEDQYLYCFGSKVDHGFGILPDFRLDPNIPFEDQERNSTPFVAKFKRDRFASLASTYRARFDVEIGPVQGKELRINAVTRGDGVIKVAIAEQSIPLHLCPRKSEFLPGFSFEDCVPFVGDSVGEPIRFKKKTIADLPVGKSFILRFEINRGEVFGYEWV